jgi:hypothetical protein
MKAEGDRLWRGRKGKAKRMVIVFLLGLAQFSNITRRCNTQSRLEIPLLNYVLCRLVFFDSKFESFSMKRQWEVDHVRYSHPDSPRR